MEESGESATGAEQPATPLPPPEARPTRRPHEPTATDGRGFVIAGVLALVAIVGLVAWMARPTTGSTRSVARRSGSRPPTTLPPPTTAPPPTTRRRRRSLLGAGHAHHAARRRAATDAAADGAAHDLDAATTTVPADVPPPTTDAVLPGEPPPSTAPDPTIPLPPDDPEYIARLVPSLAGVRRVPVDAGAGQGPGRPAAGDRPPRRRRPRPGGVDLRRRPDGPAARRPGRWERDGRRIASTELERRDAPGLRRVPRRRRRAARRRLPTSTSPPTPTATSRPPAASSSAPTRIEQRFVNNGDVDVCAIRIAPSVEPLLRGLRVRRAADRPRCQRHAARRRRRPGRRDGAAATTTVLASFAFRPTSEPSRPCAARARSRRPTAASARSAGRSLVSIA